MRSALVSCLSSATSAAGRPKTSVLSSISLHSRAASWSSFLGFSSLDFTSSSTYTKHAAESSPLPRSGCCSALTPPARAASWPFFQLAAREWREIDDNTLVFGRPAAEVAELKQLTKADLISFFQVSC